MYKETRVMKVCGETSKITSGSLAYIKLQGKLIVWAETTIALATRQIRHLLQYPALSSQTIPMREHSPKSCFEGLLLSEAYPPTDILLERRKMRT